MINAVMQYALAQIFNNTLETEIRAIAAQCAYVLFVNG